MTTKAEQNRQRIAANKLAAYERKVMTLTGHVGQRIPAKDIHEAYAAEKAAETFAAEVASREPVGLALHPAKVDAVKQAADRARESVAKVRADLIAHGWDINAAAPYPYRGSDYDPAVKAARMKSNRYSGLTKDDPAKGYQSHRPDNAPRFVIMNDDAVARFVESAERMAAAEYDAFIVKMVGKVGECDGAKIEGNHIWSYSFLTVTKSAATEVWKTQQITNYTKYGDAYAQWPSRLLK